MNMRTIGQTWWTIALIAAVALPAAVAWAQEAGDEADDGPKNVIVESVDDAPKFGSRIVEKRLKKLDEDHKLQITIGRFFDQGHTTSSNEFEPYVAAAVPVNKEGERDGVQMFHRPRSGSAERSVVWADGVKQGPEKVYGRGGKVIEIKPWVDNKIHGEVKTFDLEGNVLSVAHYEKGVQVGVSKSFDSEGRLLREVPYKDGEKHGKRVDYWPQTGEPKRVVPYRKGLAHGEVVEYHLNGEVKRRVNTIEGQLHGREEVFSDEGKLITVRYWWDGGMVSQSEFEAKQKAEKK